jgi:hypothetical protein
MTNPHHESVSGRHGRGVFDCPVDDCHEAIVGSYGDLLDHVRGEHPLERILVDEDRNTVLDRIKQAQKDALKQDIRQHMVVGSKQNQRTANGGNS